MTNSASFNDSSIASCTIDPILSVDRINGTPINIPLSI